MREKPSPNLGRLLGHLCHFQIWVIGTWFIHDTRMVGKRFSVGLSVIGDPLFLEPPRKL